MNRKFQNVKPLPQHASDEQAAEWIERYDLLDRVRSGVTEEVHDHSEEDVALEVYLDRAASEHNTAKLSLLVPPSLKSLLTRLAQDKHTDAGTLARVWLTERIRHEAQRKRKGTRGGVRTQADR